jgi:hypothetical protein
MLKDKILCLLEAADWKTIIFKLTRYAYWISRKYSWYSGKNDLLSAGKTHEDIACEAVEKIWKGTRDWDPDKYPDLLVHLKWIVKSDIEHLFSSSENQTTVGISEIRYKEDSQMNCIENLPESSFIVPGKTSSPDAELDVNERNAYNNKLLNELYKKVEGDEDLGLLLICFEEGIDKAAEIAKQTGWEISKVYNLKRKISRKAADIFNNSQKGE